MHVRGSMETSGVGCAIPVWRSSMPCSGVPSFVPVRCFVVRSLLPKVHLYGSHAPLPENKRLSSFLMVHTEKRACASLRGYRNRPDGGRSPQWEPRLPVIRDHYHCSGFATLHVLEHYGDHLWWLETEIAIRIDRRAPTAQLKKGHLIITRYRVGKSMSSLR